MGLCPAGALQILIPKDQGYTFLPFKQSLRSVYGAWDLVSMCVPFTNLCLANLKTGVCHALYCKQKVLEKHEVPAHI